MSDKFELDAAGMVVTRPVMGWDTATAMETAVILRLRYAEKPADFSGEGRQLQVILTPQQCLDLADQLTKSAQHLLQTKPASAPN